MPKVATNINLDANLKQQSIELYSELGMDLSTAVTIFLVQSLKAQGLPFIVSREIPNADTIAAMNEYNEVKTHPERYKKYTSFKAAREEVLADV